MEFQSAEDTLKAVILSGQKVGGCAVKIEAVATTPKKGRWNQIIMHDLDY